MCVYVRVVPLKKLSEQLTELSPTLNSASSPVASPPALLIIHTRFLLHNAVRLQPRISTVWYFMGTLLFLRWEELLSYSIGPLWKL